MLSPTLWSVGTLFNSASQPESPKRNLLIDFLRGLCLVVMTVDHLPPDIFEKFTWQTFGFISAAEGFVFLSGLVSGVVYGRVAMQEGITTCLSANLAKSIDSLSCQCGHDYFDNCRG